MEQIEIKNLSFLYPPLKVKALNKINISIKSGEYIVLCGRSGCGKTTLLRHMKSVLMPKGKKTGEMFFCGKLLAESDLREQSQKIGFVMQNPDNQIVTDKVWHELAFGLENLGLDTSQIRLRVAEMASYFGIGEWFDKKVNELSGGQKQLMNLASVMAMHPEVLILDEPTSQLDPIAAENFLSTVDRINKELGVTVIITEHRLEEVFSYADRVIVMENGEIIADAPPAEIGSNLSSQPEFIRLSVPTATRVFNAADEKGKCPITVREGRSWLRTFGCCGRFNYEIRHESEEIAAELRNVSFRYTKDGEDILKNLSLKVPKQSVFAVLGGNGEGKSTLVRVISGVSRAYTGKVKINAIQIEKYKNKDLYYNNLAVLPQDVQALFTSKTVRLELEGMCADEKRISEICELTDIDCILDSHPFDLSGGEQQRAALAKVLLTNPKILLLDEPTKGMDSEFKIKFAGIISTLRNNGCTVMLISHDVEFCAKYADRCAMLFDGQIATQTDTHTFFNENHFYTTAANRMSRGIINGAITDEEVISCLKDN